MGKKVFWLVSPNKHLDNKHALFKCAMTHKHQTLRALPFLIALLLTAGCGGSSDNVPLPGPDPTTLSLSTPTPDGLTAALMQDKAVIAVTTGTVNYTMTLTNTSQSPVAVSVPQDSMGNPLPPVSLSVKSSAGEPVYPATAGSGPVKGGTQQTLTLQPGDFVQQTLQLSNAFRVIGRYQATATFTTNAGPTIVGPLTLTAR